MRGYRFRVHPGRGRQYLRGVALTITDPGHIALRKGIRAAVALPLAIAIALYAVDDVSGMLFTVFGTVGLLINADFAGSTRQRTASYLLTGLAGSVALAVGWAASFVTAVAVVVTVVVAFALSFVNLMRGTDRPRHARRAPRLRRGRLHRRHLDRPARLPAGLVDRRRGQHGLRPPAVPAQSTGGPARGARVRFTAAARCAERTWVSPATPESTGFADYAAAVDRLDAEYGGAPYRTSGLTEP